MKNNRITLVVLLLILVVVLAIYFFVQNKNVVVVAPQNSATANSGQGAKNLDDYFNNQPTGSVSAKMN